MNELQKVQILECAKGKWQREIAKQIIECMEDGFINPCASLQGRSRKEISNYQRSMFNLFERVEKLPFIESKVIDYGCRGGLWKAIIRFYMKD